MKSDFNKNIQTSRTKLRKYIESDREAFVDLFLNKEVIKYMGGPHYETREEANNLFDKSKEIYNGLFPGRHFEIWAIESEGKMIGHFELKQTNNTAENELEVVYLLDKNYWGRGLMPEIISEVNKYATKIGICLIATINPDNIKTIRALNKEGIEKEEWLEDDEGKVYKVWLKKSEKKSD